MNIYFTLWAITQYYHYFYCCSNCSDFDHGEFLELSAWPHPVFEYFLTCCTTDTPASYYVFSAPAL